MLVDRNVFKPFLIAIRPSNHELAWSVVGTQTENQRLFMSRAEAASTNHFLGQLFRSLRQSHTSAHTTTVGIGDELKF